MRSAPLLLLTALALAALLAAPAFAQDAPPVADPDSTEARVPISLIPLDTTAQAERVPLPPALASSPRLYGGVALGPGLFAAYARPVLSVLTVEGTLYADYDPRILGTSGRLLVGAGVGGSVRLLQLAEIADLVDARQLSLDAGVRFGPAFYIAFFEQTAASEARAFSVLFDPFVRGQTRLGSNRVVFGEVGLHEPILRAGLSVAVGG